jgi:ATP-binding cassette subfamily B protein
VVALAILIAFLLAEHAVGSLSSPFRRHMGARIDGELRRRARVLLSSPPGVAHLEDQTVRDDAHRVTRGVTGRTLGQGVEAQIATWIYMAGAGLAALVAARIAPELAAFTVAAMLFMRFVLAKQISGYVGMSAALTGQVRRGKYWIDVAGGPAAAKEVRLFGLANWAVDRQFDEAMRSRRPVFEGVDLFNKRQWKPFAIAAVGYGVPFAVLAVRAANGDISPSELATIAPALGSIGMIGSPGFDAFFIEAAIPCCDSMARLERLAELAPAAGTVTATIGDSPTVRFHRVGFTYPGTTTPVLDGLDLEVPAGKSLAIVGANGAGKTTLIKLLTRLYEPTEGRITVDGSDLSSVDAAAWRRRVSVIFQDFVHYELSAADNVGTAELGAVDRGRLQAAADDAGAGSIIASLPGGWDTIASRAYADGSDLSGGQWQRVALARLLYGLHAGRSILVLDEPTANLDVEAEIEVFDRLLERARGRTVVLISHRFSTVRRADKIAVIDAGRLIESGTHGELLAAGGRYAEMFHQQADRYLDTDAARAEAGAE